MLGQLFPEPPLVTFRRCPTIRDKLVRSYLKPEGQQTWLGSKPKGSYKCQHCNHCTNVLQSKTFVDTVSLKQFTINHFISCKTVFVIYRLECPECKVFYIGRTKRCLQDRLAEHKYAIRTDNMNYPMARHYREHHNSDPSTVQICGIDHIPLSLRKGDRQKQLNQRESFWIDKLQATSYPGLNEELDLSVFL